MSTSITKPLKLRHGPPSFLPALIYGTAWKGERTAGLVHEALRAGFRAIDTAAQPRHYREDLVGEGIRRAISEGIVKRSDLFLQTKFTPIWAQDEDDLPYDHDADLEEQVRQSVEGSLDIFDFSDVQEKQQKDADEKGVGKKDEDRSNLLYIDCLVLHSPMPSPQETLKVWNILASYVPHQIRHLGISNTPLQHLSHLLTNADVRPSVVQNRIHEDGYQPDVYAACRSEGIAFQAFSALTGNPNLVSACFTNRVATGAGVGGKVALYALLLGMDGWTVLDGTIRRERMVGDLEGIEKVGRWKDGEGKEVWEQCFRELKWEMGIEW